MKKLLCIFACSSIVLIGGDVGSFLPQIQPGGKGSKPAAAIPFARELAVDRARIEQLVLRETTSDRAFCNLRDSNSQFECLESSDHSRLCPCRGRRKLTITQLLDATIYGDIRLFVFEVDEDNYAVERVKKGAAGILYDYSKACLMVPSKLRAIQERYARSFSFYEPTSSFCPIRAKSRDQMKREEAVLEGIVAMVCGCHGRKMHKSCIESIVVGTAHKERVKCLHCREDITHELKFMRHNFVFDGRGQKCLMCRKDLWNSRTRKKVRRGEIQIFDTSDVP